MSQTLTVQDIADELQLNPQTVRDWCKSGKLEAFNIGTSSKAIWRVPQPAFDKFKRQRLNKPHEAAQSEKCVREELKRLGVL